MVRSSTQAAIRNIVSRLAKEKTGAERSKTGTGCATLNSLASAVNRRTAEENHTKAGRTSTNATNLSGNVLLGAGTLLKAFSSTAGVNLHLGAPGRLTEA
jgi:hypothetical protein